jgi:hypothetical protein
MEKIIAVIVFLLSPLLGKAQSLKAIATGTGQTTGHIATLSITNTTQSAININPQTCYIPYDGTYQPYVAILPGTSVLPGTSSIICRSPSCPHQLSQPPGQTQMSLSNERLQLVKKNIRQT